jgi:hypothetical protein
MFFKNIYSDRSTFTASIIVNVFETDIKRLVVRAQCLPPTCLLLRPHAKKITLICSLFYTSDIQPFAF